MIEKIPLALKYRPLLFSDVVGQEQTVTKILDMFKAERSYPTSMLFVGPHGVGKTTLARLVAKRLNCLTPDKDTGDACNTCTVCQKFNNTVNNGGDTSFSLFKEVNGADVNGVDDMRNLTKEARYATSYKYKVFIIDEVHMLTNQAFQVLLKPIEEPVQNVVYILCTTEVHKVPKTIVSRSRQYTLSLVDDLSLMRMVHNVVAKETGHKLGKNVLKPFVLNYGGHVRDVLQGCEAIVDRLRLNKDIDPTEFMQKEILGKIKTSDVKALLLSIYRGDFKKVISNVPDAVKAAYVVEQLITFHTETLRYYAEETKETNFYNDIYSFVDSKRADITVLSFVNTMAIFIDALDKLKRYLIKEDALLLNCLLQATKEFV